MPSLQLDLTADLGPEAKGALAKRLSLTYSRIMGSDPRLMTVVVRTLPAGSVWHCTEGEPVPGTLLMCDVRAGRTPQTRDELARALIEIIAEDTGVAAEHIKVEFTQHAGDEMFHQHLGGFNRDSSPQEG